MQPQHQGGGAMSPAPAALSPRPTATGPSQAQAAPPQSQAAVPRVDGSAASSSETASTGHASSSSLASSFTSRVGAPLPPAPKSSRTSASGATSTTSPPPHVTASKALSPVRRTSSTSDPGSESEQPQAPKQPQLSPPPSSPLPPAAPRISTGAAGAALAAPPAGVAAVLTPIPGSAPTSPCPQLSGASSAAAARSSPMPPAHRQLQYPPAAGGSNAATPVTSPLMSTAAVPMALASDNLPALPSLDKSASTICATGASERPRSLSKDGVLLGLQELERQQFESEKRKAAAALEAEAKAKAEEEAVRRKRKEAEEALAAEATTREREDDAERQRRRRQDGEESSPSRHTRRHTAPPRPPLPAYDDGSETTATAPPSDVTTSDRRSLPPPPPSSSGVSGMIRTSSFGKFLSKPLKQTQKFRHSLSMSNHGVDDPAAPSHGPRSRRMSGAGNKDRRLSVDDDDEAIWGEQEVKPLVYGYLHKFGRNGQWQRRFFETDGECLTYYKSRKRVKLLATLDLCKVGEIAVDQTDPTGCTFTIQVANRPYYLRAANKGKCKDWVISLNRVREARMEVGNIHLVTPHFHHDQSNKNRSESGEYAARVVVSANRGRTHAMNNGDLDGALAQQLDADAGFGGGEAAPEDDATPAMSGGEGDVAKAVGDYQPSSSNRPPRLIEKLPPQMLARWQKRRSNVQRLSLKLVRWARRVRMMRACAVEEGDVVGVPGYAARSRATSAAEDVYGGNDAESYNDGGVVRSSSWTAEKERVRGGGNALSDVDEVSDVRSTSQVSSGRDSPIVTLDEESDVDRPEVC